MMQNGLLNKILAVVRRRRLDEELDDEIRAHLEMAVEAYIARGVPRPQAEAAARRDFGRIERAKERHRDVRRFGPLEDLVRDTRLGIRSLLKRPGFSAMAVASLAIGIGANAAIFTVVNAFLLQDLPFDRPHELVNIYESNSTASGIDNPLSYPDVVDIRDETRDVFTGIAASVWAPTQVESEQGGGVTTVFTEVVTGEYFNVLGIDAWIGRTILPEDDLSPDGHPVLMLGYDYWQTRFAANPDAVGRQIRISGRPFTIVGVAPPDFRGGIRGMEAQFFAPSSMLDVIYGTEMRGQRGNHATFARARLAPGVSIAQAQAAVNGIATDACLTASAREAHDLGYSVHVVDDAAASFDRWSVQGDLILAELVHQVSIAALAASGIEVLSTAELNAALQQVTEAPGLTLAYMDSSGVSSATARI